MEKRQLILIEEGSYQQSRQIFTKTEAVEAIDLTTRTRLLLQAGQLSAYRHLLYANGKSFRIQSILKLAD